MTKGSKGLSGLAIVIIVAVIIVVLLVLAFSFNPGGAEPSTEPNGEIPENNQPESGPASEGLIPLDEIHESLLEAFPEVVEEYPDGIPWDVLQELEARMNL